MNIALVPIADWGNYRSNMHTGDVHDVCYLRRQDSTEPEKQTIKPMYASTNQVVICRHDSVGCFGGTGYWSFQKGLIYGQTLPKNIANITQAEVTWWWDFLNRCGYAITPKKDDPYTGEILLERDSAYGHWISIMTLLDTPQRFRGMFNMMMELDKRVLGKIPAWHVLQICFMFPFANYELRTSYAIKVDENQIGSCYGLPYHAGGHSISGCNSGIFKLSDSTDLYMRHGGPAGRYFPQGNGMILPATTTWDEFAEWAIQHSKESGKKEKAA